MAAQSAGTERNLWKDLNKKHDVSSFDSAVHTRDDARRGEASDIISPYPDLFRLCISKMKRTKEKGWILQYKYFCLDYLR